MTDPLLKSYEAFPYDGRPVPTSHPENIATWAMLHGVEPPSLDRCRVLELGCGTGGNLLPMATAMRDSTFVGVDLSPRQIAMGCAMAHALGLNNLRLEAKSILDLNESLGNFDYIICHGVYSWVPAEVSDAILRVTARHLAAGGVAYVSYNTYPGWHLRGMMRDMILYHDQPELGAQARIARGRAMADFVTRSTPRAHEAYSRILEDELQVLGTQSDTHFLHEQLEPQNNPCYFAEFVRRAGTHGLKYLGEAQVSVTEAALLPEARAAVESWTPDVVRRQQYIDFLINRTFRRTLLCHEPVAVEHELRAERVRGLHVVGRVERRPADADAAPGSQTFRSPEAVTATSNSPLLLATLNSLLDAGVAGLAFPDLWDRAHARLLETSDVSPDAARVAAQGSAALAETVLQCTLAGLAELHLRPPRLATQPGEHPIGSVLARRQAEESARVSSLRHYPVMLNPVDRFVLLRLDGSCDRAAVASAMADAVRNGELNLDPLGPDASSDLPGVVEASINRLAQTGLLEPAAT